MSQKSMRIKNDDDLIAMARADIVTFSRWPLEFTGKYELYPAQIEWQEQAQDMFELAMADPVTARNLVILGPSEHGKTTGLNVPFVLWALANNRNLRIGILGSNEAKAHKIGTAIDRQFRLKKKALARFGLEPGYPWNASEKTLVRDDDKIMDPSIFCFGPESDLQGYRFDILLGVDLFTFKNQRTPEMRSKMQEFLENVVFPRMEDHSFQLYDGHHVSDDDQYTRWEDDEENWKVVKYKAIHEEKSEAFPDGKVLWPNKWSYDKLRKKRSIAPGTFELIFQNNPIAKAGTLERAAFDRILDRGRSMRNALSPEEAKGYDKIVAMVDPAFSVSKRSAWSVMHVVGIHDNGTRRDFLHSWRLKMLPHHLKSKIMQTFFSFLPDELYIEANAAQALLVSDVKQQLGSYASRVIPVYTNSWNPEDSIEHGIGRMIQKMDSQEISLPYNGQSAREMADQLFVEIRNYPGRPNDSLMAWWVGEEGMRRHSISDRGTTVYKNGITTQVGMQVYDRRAEIPGRYDKINEKLWRSKDGK